MSAWWWSYMLAAIGVFGLWLTGRKLWQGFAVGVAVQTLWIAYAIVTEQWGFIGSALAFGWMNSWNLWKWLRERRAEKDDEPRYLPADVLLNGRQPCGYMGECLLPFGHPQPHALPGHR